MSTACYEETSSHDLSNNMRFQKKIISHAQDIEIQLQTHDATLNLTIDNSDSVLDLRVLIFHKTSILPSKQYITFHGSPLELDSKISDAGLQEGSTIVVRDLDKGLTQALKNGEKKVIEKHVRELFKNMRQASNEYARIKDDMLKASVTSTWEDRGAADMEGDLLVKRLHKTYTKRQLYEYDLKLIDAKQQHM